ncbi:MAG: hypothetical protein JSW11_21025 [Candidatus Heimdallarchaeota archaeon]|nr:MAG: hypothetical protein JSW11_21025 [Candidatus Heimdallarchaeota archaeon]
MQSSDCEKLVEEATEASKHSLDVSAKIFEDAAKCFDKLGDRRKAGQYLTLAGDFFLDLDNKEKAATCYGKAIMRHLMIDDIDTAEILLEKGKEYGFSSSTHQYRIALDALERQTTTKIEEEISEEQVPEIEVLPEIDILPIEEEEDLIPLKSDLFSLDEDVQPKKQEFIIPQLEKEQSSTLSSYAVLAAVSQATREKSTQEIKTNAFVKNTSGESQFLEPQFELSPIQPIETLPVLSGKSTIDHSTEVETKDVEVPTESLDESDTLDLDYAAKAEITNEFEDELVDIEIINTIPFNFEVVKIKADFKLDEKKPTNEGLVFTWKKDRIEPGEKISVEYILRKRVERSIVLRKENKVSVVNLFHSVQQQMQANLDFVNTSGKVFYEILIEDVIPPELIVNETKTNKKIKPVTIPTHDSTLYRWIFSSLPPGDNFSVLYEFREKPLTRHYKDEIDCTDGLVRIEKISQPIVDSNQYEYMWLFFVEKPIPDNITIIDRIPSDFKLLLVDPPHLNPSIKKEKTHQELTWRLSPEEVPTAIILRISGEESFTPLAPSIEFARGDEIQLIERSTSSEKKLVDIRRLSQSQKESK